jgi:ferredoxin
MCRYMSRGIKEACCINFGVMSEIIDRLPRFIPEKDSYHLSRAEAVARFREFNRRGYIGTIWFGPYPYINNLCSCANPECAGLRPRVDYGILSIYKAEYAAEADPQRCTGCRACVEACPFGALEFDERGAKVRVRPGDCYGCGVCRHACPAEALYLTPRDQLPALAGRY